MVDVRFELTTNDPWSVDDAICEGISPLGYWQKVNQSPTQTKPYIKMPSVSHLLVRNEVRFQNLDFGFVIASPNLTHVETPSKSTGRGILCIMPAFLRFRSITSTRRQNALKAGHYGNYSICFFSPNILNFPK